MRGTEDRFSFKDLEPESLRRLISQYRDGLRDHDEGRVNFPCGGNSPRTVRRWLKAAEAELAAR